MAEAKVNQTDANQEFSKNAVIRVIGVGGGGCNAVNRMIETGVKGIGFVAINTDNQALERSQAQTRVRIGEKLTKGLGAGADPEVGAKAATESRDDIAGIIRGTDLLFITAGMGGGTGTGGAPVVAQIAQDMGVLTVGVVTKPFRFEGAQRSINADRGITELAKYVDSLIIVPNDKLLDIAEEDTTVDQAFSMADHVLRYGITGISDLVAVPGLINLDMADVRRVMTDAGICHMGIGRAQGPDRVLDAIDEAIHSPLLDTSIDGARRLIVNFTGSNMKIREVSEASSVVRDSASPNADIIIGAVIDDSLDDELMITVIASGFDDVPAAEEEDEDDVIAQPNFRAVGTQSTAAARPQTEQPSYSRSSYQQEQPAERPRRQSPPSYDYKTNYEEDNYGYEPNYRQERRDYQPQREQRTTDYSSSAQRDYENRRPSYEREERSYGGYERPSGRSYGSEREHERSHEQQAGAQHRESSDPSRNANNNKSGRILPWLFNDTEK